jgi:dihydroorotate dehydrogenase electron transfer subunit
MVTLRLSVGGWRQADPGQFAMVRARGSRCFLPRAFSVHSEGLPAGPGAPARVSFLVSPVGAATEELAALIPGDEVSVLGPLGRGFDLSGRIGWRSPAGDFGDRLLVVGGGVGVAPFLLLLERLGCRADAGHPIPGEIVILFGFRDGPQAAVLDLFESAVADLRAAGSEVRLEAICEDGSLGRAGLVTRLLSEELRRGDTVAACGAHAMCEAVWDLCLGTEGVESWFSLEAGMACGVGSCQGCVIPVAGGGLAKVCRQGPVFPGREVFGDALHPCVGGGGGP